MVFFLGERETAVGGWGGGGRGRGDEAKEVGGGGKGEDVRTGGWPARVGRFQK